MLAGAATLVLAALFTRSTDTDKSPHRLGSSDNPYRYADFRVEIIPTATSTYGYDILMDGHVLIHQPHVPALPGNDGFQTENDARKVAEFVVGKLRRNIFPPSVSVEELDSLGVLKPGRD